MTDFKPESIWHPPGQRILKTSLAVTLCLIYYMLKGYEGDSLPAEAAITAIICMQPYVHDTTASGLNRLAGTAVGAVWGFLFLVCMMLFPALGRNRFILYPLMGIGTLIALHSAVLFRMPDASGLAAIVFICVVVAYPDIENPMDQAFHRMLDVLLGAGIAVFVNWVHLPRVRRPGKVFFLPMACLTDNQFTQLSPPVLFRIQYLLRRGAKICLMSEHAPAFQASQIGMEKCTVPMIVMDGAAIYDPVTNEYIATTNLNPASCRWLMKRLDNRSYFIYTVHRDRNSIYHHGELSEADTVAYKYLKRSPYRYYLDDDRFSVSDVVYIKLILAREDAERLQRELEPSLEKMKLRSVIRPQAGVKDAWALYLYAVHADMEHARAHLMQILRQKEPGLETWLPAGKGEYTGIGGAVRLLRKVDGEYEPLVVTEWIRKARAKKRAKAG